MNMTHPRRNMKIRAGHGPLVEILLTEPLPNHSTVYLQNCWPVIARHARYLDKHTQDNRGG